MHDRATCAAGDQAAESRTHIILLLTGEMCMLFISEGSGRPIIFLPGYTASSAVHRRDVHRYAERYLASSLDFLGTGASDRVSPWPERAEERL